MKQSLAIKNQFPVDYFPVGRRGKIQILFNPIFIDYHSDIPSACNCITQMALLPQYYPVLPVRHVIGLWES